MKEEKEQLTDKLLRLHNQLADKKKDKKVMMASYRDEIKDIEEEIEDVVTKLNELTDD